MAAEGEVDLSHWEKQGGTVLQKTATNGRIRRTYIAPTGEKFYSWKECVKYLASGKDSDNSQDMGRKKPKKEADPKQEDPKKVEVVQVEGDDSHLMKSKKLPKRAATGMNYKEKRFRLDSKESIIKTKKDRTAEEEDIAIVLTADAQYPDCSSPHRRLTDFIVHDNEGTSQPMEMVDVIDLYISGLILPKEGTIDKSKGVRCEGFGIVETWAITGYENGSPVIWLTTGAAEYICVKPAASYKIFYSILYEKAMLCVEVYRALSKPDGGNPDLELDELVVRVSRSLSSNKTFQGRFTGRDYIISQGELIVNQLTGLDRESEEDDQLFTGLPCLVALENECIKASRKGSVGIKIGEGSTAATSSLGAVSCSVIDEDEKLARLIQEEKDWEATKMSRKSQGKKKFYIKINEDEIANDYPLPAFYKAADDEMDEYVLFDEDSTALDPEDLPRRMLHDWSLYNSDSRLVPLELIPMLAGTETDNAIFGSGIMSEDDGSGYCLDKDSGANHKSQENDPQGICIYLSAIKEWMIEFGANMLFISIRTDGAWYRLGKPSRQYAPWYKPVVKTARLAIKVIVMLKEQSRASKLSFSDVIRKLVSQDRTEPTFISSKLDDVERYVVVHGQIILQQFAEYPDEHIQRSAFVTGLSIKMEQRHHTKLFLSKKKQVIVKEQNLNPRAYARSEASKPSKNAMRATTTQFINRIWSEYYASSGFDEAKEDNGENDAEEQDQEESEDEEETVLAVENVTIPPTPIRTRKNNSSCKEAEWVGHSTGKTASGELLYKSASVHGCVVAVGGAVLVGSEEKKHQSEALLTILFVEYMYEKPDGKKMLHGRVLQKGSETVLGNAANSREVFLTTKCIKVDINDVKETVEVEIRLRPWGYQYRKENMSADEADRVCAAEREKKKLPVQFFCKSLYAPEKGAFLSLPYYTLGLGNGQCHSCTIVEQEKQNMELCMLENNDGFRHEGVEYHVHDFIYVDPEQFLDGGENEPAEKFKASRNRGLHAYVVCQILEIKSSSGLRKTDSKPTKVKARRFFRPEEVGPEKAYTADIQEVYYSDETVTVEVVDIRGKCVVIRQQYFCPAPGNVIFDHIFFCGCIYDPKKGTLKQLPANIRLGSAKSSGNVKGKIRVDEAENAKRKGKAVSGDQTIEKVVEGSSDCLSTLDIFAGCGGLSEGLHHSGVCVTKWAIEYEEPAAEAFKLNHPDAEVFCANCNVILRSIMEKGGDIDDCISTSEAVELSSKLTDDQKAKLPLPGQVDFINGGPPCQGFSGMNRFNHRAWSKVQCEMILAFLSYADYFRPRFFLLENVRNFVSFNKGQTFRLSLASLLEMGYQVRFGVLQAGNYGVSQSRKRAFIWASSPEDFLPDWPEPMHVFASSQLKISLPGGLQYSAVRDAALGAPFRSITVRDTIGDLPPVGNGADKLELTYVKAPVSWFQKQIRDVENVLYDHISKEMNELNNIRCQRIPKRPGADWRDLPEEKVKLSTGQLVDLIPWCLPNTADRHNQWKGLFGRLDWEGNFPTSITDPQPMGKVGMCFHPEQDRIVTVRECARSQGFPDKYKFCGNIQSKHRQIGNAVPPPLAMALGKKLKEAVEAKKVHANENVV